VYIYAGIFILFRMVLNRSSPCVPLQARDTEASTSHSQGGVQRHTSWKPLPMPPPYPPRPDPLSRAAFRSRGCYMERSTISKIFPEKNPPPPLSRVLKIFPEIFLKMKKGFL